MKFGSNIFLMGSTWQGGARNFPTGGLTLQTRGLKYGFQGTINARNLRKIAFHFPTGASMLRWGLYPPSPPVAPPLLRGSSIFHDQRKINVLK